MYLPCFGCEDWLNVWEKDAVYDLAQSTVASLTLEEIIALGCEKPEEFFSELNKKKMNYGWIEGSPEFKEEVSRLYRNVSTDQILQTNGATGANLLVLYSMIQPGDHVIALHPSYQQLYDIPRSIGASLDFWELKESNNWLPDLEELEYLVRPETKMICINNANNPTGTVMEETFLLKLVEFARKHGIYILSDEVYKPLDQKVQVPAIVDIYEKGISTNSISKTYSVPGIRVGWVVASYQLTEIFKIYRDYTMICCGVFDDFLATYVLKNKEALLERNKKIVSDNLEILKTWIENEPKASLVYPKQVSTSFVKLDIKADIEDFCIRLLKERGVLLIPGNRFDIPGHVRLGYCTHTEVLKAGLSELSKALQEEE